MTDTTQSEPIEFWCRTCSQHTDHDTVRRGQHVVVWICRICGTERGKSPR